jgi:Holliday junction resolvasome RuvABC DNA-binding subunit
MAEKLESRLLKLKERIENARTEVAKYEGRLSSHLDALKDLGYKNEKAGQAALQKLKDEVSKLENEIEDELDQLESTYAE